MNPLDIQLEAAAAMLRAAGGHVGSMDKDAPDYVKKAWLKILMECPDCRQAMMGKNGGKGN